MDVRYERTSIVTAYDKYIDDTGEEVEIMASNPSWDVYVDSELFGSDRDIDKLYELVREYKNIIELEIK